MADEGVNGAVAGAITCRKVVASSSARFQLDRSRSVPILERPWSSSSASSRGPRAQHNAVAVGAARRPWSSPAGQRSAPDAVATSCRRGPSRAALALIAAVGGADEKLRTLEDLEWPCALSGLTADRAQESSTNPASVLPATGHPPAPRRSPPHSNLTSSEFGSSHLVALGIGAPVSAASRPRVKVELEEDKRRFAEAETPTRLHTRTRRLFRKLRRTPSFAKRSVRQDARPLLDAPPGAQVAAPLSPMCPPSGNRRPASAVCLRNLSKAQERAHDDLRVDMRSVPRCRSAGSCVDNLARPPTSIKPKRELVV
eukprot:TRINITY_DN21055_c0_g1_i1.p1 TRINITY_DN21055_c0_g1~~TRINITY_DN21055_c0_g1_i1.p1  ORF type:complete len:313 (+),score=31.68 TRINITY_DN21055_c0_g1_i1:101-1039(+)